MLSSQEKNETRYSEHCVFCFLKKSWGQGKKKKEKMVWLFLRQTGLKCMKDQFFIGTAKRLAPKMSLNTHQIQLQAVVGGFRNVMEAEILREQIYFDHDVSNNLQTFDDQMAALQTSHNNIGGLFNYGVTQRLRRNFSMDNVASWNKKNIKKNRSQR